jgi:hypothetical protein
MATILLGIAKTIIMKLLAPELAIKLFISVGEWLVKQSDNKLDDEVMASVKAQLEKKDEEK